MYIESHTFVKGNLIHTLHIHGIPYSTENSLRHCSLKTNETRDVHHICIIIVLPYNIERALPWLNDTPGTKNKNHMVLLPIFFTYFSLVFASFDSFI